MNIADPIWEISEGSFLPFNINESILFAEATGFIDKIKRLYISESIYLRGSLLESKKPFSKSDIDVFVIYNSAINRQEIYGKIKSCSDRELDLKWISSDYLKADYVFYALLAHRSILINGIDIKFEPLRAER